MSDATAKMPGLTKKSPIPPLLALPAELRNRIYEEAIINNDKSHELIINSKLREPPLTFVCRQVRHETREMWYINHRFCFKFMRVTKEELEAWWRLTEHVEGGLKVRTEGSGVQGQLKESLAVLATSDLFDIVQPISGLSKPSPVIEEDERLMRYKAHLIRKR